MKRHKTSYNRKFDVNNHIVNIDLISQCVTSNPQERSYRKKLCKIVFSNAVKDNNIEFIQIYFSSMRAAAIFIADHIDANTIKFNIFGKQYDTHRTVLLCNFKLYTIDSIDNINMFDAVFKA